MFPDPQEEKCCLWAIRLYVPEFRVVTSCVCSVATGHNCGSSGNLGWKKSAKGLDVLIGAGP